jgi:LEA14-like dessication related protein
MSDPRKSALLLLTIGILAAGCIGVPKNLDQLKEPTVSLAGLALNEADLFSPSFLVRLRVENPNDLDVTLDGADAALALNGQPVASGVSRSQVGLARFGSSDLAVQVTANTLGVIQQMLALQNQPNLNYQVTGHLQLLNWLGPLGRVPFSFQGAVDRETLLRGAANLGDIAAPSRR